MTPPPDNPTEAEFESFLADLDAEPEPPEDSDDCPMCGGSGGGEGYWSCPGCAATGRQKGSDRDDYEIICN